MQTTASLPRNTLPGSLHSWATASSLALLVGWLCRWVLELCPCTTMLVLGTCAALHCALVPGARSVAALTMEREKKTLDSLRLTTFTTWEILWYKARPDVQVLVGLWLGWAPVLFLLGLGSDLEMSQLLGVTAVCLSGGVFAIALSLLISSLATSTSQAVVQGWILKGVWLLLLPLLDLVVVSVSVDRVRLPIFSSLNPLLMGAMLQVRESLPQAGAWLSLAWPVTNLLAIGAMLAWTVRRFDGGLVSDAGVKDRAIHPIYNPEQARFWLRWVSDMMGGNPAFARELAAQLRAGAGRWPGIAVFAVLFYAPTFYTQAWSVNDLSRPKEERVIARPADQAPVALGSGAIEQAASGKRSTWLRTSEGTCVQLVGHRSAQCARMWLLGTFGIPLPAGSVRYYQVAQSSVEPSSLSHSTTSVSTLQPTSSPDEQTAALLGLSKPAASPIDEEAQRDAWRRSLRNGLLGSLALLVLYLCIRCSAFVATAVTAEKAHATWDDLVLSGLRPSELLTGKAVAAVLLPWLQLTLAAPLLLGYVNAGVMTGGEAIAIYVYASSLIAVCAALGLLASARSRSSHEAHLTALGCVLAACSVAGMFALVVSLARPLAGVLLLLLGVIYASRARSSNVQAAAMLLPVLALVCPWVLSPTVAAWHLVPALTGVSLVSAFVTLISGVLFNLALATVLAYEARCALSGGGEDDVILATAQ